MPGGHRTALPGQPGPSRRLHPRGRARRQDPRHRRHARRDLRPHRPAPRAGPQARRRAEGGPEQPVQALPAAADLRRQHAGAGRWRAAHAEPGRLHPPLGEPPARRDRPPHRVPEARGRRARPHPAGLSQGPRHAGRGHRPHPRLRGHRHRPYGPYGAAGHRPGAGGRHPGHAAAHADPHEPRQDRGRA